MSELSRRSFVNVAAGAAIAAVGSASVVSSAMGSARSGGATVRVRPNTGARKLRKAVMIGMCGDGANVMEKFKVLKDAGFDGVEMDSPTSIPMSDIVKASEATGIKVHGMVDSVHWKYHLNNPEAKVRQMGLDGLIQCLRDAHTCGSTSVLLVPAVVNEQMPYDKAWELSVEQIKKALPVAEELKVQIAVENVWNNFLLSPLEAARYVDEFKSAWVKWHLDLGNIANYGWADQWVRILGDRVVKLHIKEFSRKKRNDEGLWKGFEVDLMGGDNNWPAIMKALDDVGYTGGEGGWATIEMGGGDAKRMKQLSEMLDKITASQLG
ncbi:MAG: sugar phosphate isomerase/epimerase [Phycisphaerae bacterium]|nr:sugar phosphate isomerase/epimerase [Phycisphaerae bacterium]